jgi:superfamily II DNA/RNA helicase
LFKQFDFKSPLTKALDALSFAKPTAVQEKALPVAMSGKDLMVCAQTGSGKSAAFLLPILQRILSEPAPNSKTRALVLVPTRELARQLLKQCEALAKFTKVQAACITGGAEYKYQTAMFRKNPEIIIATPGRLIEHLQKSSDLMSDVEMLVLDEADRMLDMGFADEVISIADQCNPDHQTMLFSATLKKQGIKHVMDSVLTDAVNIVVDSFRGEHSNITQQKILADDDKHKQRLLTWILSKEEFRQAIIFTNTKVKTESLFHFLEYHSINAAVLHGDMTQDERNFVMQRMQQGTAEVLVATDVAARGLDVKKIDLVVNFDIPRSGDDYVHRIGRTGRAESNGLAISLVDTTEWNLTSSIERYLKVEMATRKIKELEGSYKGPKSLKGNGKSAGKKTHKKKDAKKSAKIAPKKPSGKKPSKDPSNKPVKPGTKITDEETGIKIKRKKPTPPKVISDGSAPFKPRKK